MEILHPVPSCLKRSAELKKGLWALTLLGNITSFKRSTKALQNLYGTVLTPILISPDAFPPEVLPQENELESSDQSPAPEHVWLLHRHHRDPSLALEIEILLFYLCPTSTRFISIGNPKSTRVCPLRKFLLPTRTTSNPRSTSFRVRLSTALLVSAATNILKF